MPEDRAALLSRVEERLRDELSLDDAVFRQTPMAGSKQGACLRIETEALPERAFVLKVFSPSPDFDCRSAARNEFEALARFSLALTEGNGPVACPVPVQLFEGDAAYLMTFVVGETLDRRFGRGPVAGEVARRVTEGLGVYYDALDGAYMDFHPGNVLVESEGGVAMIDPTLPDAYFRDVDLGPLHPATKDLGYWVFTECAKAAKRSLLSRGQNEVRFEFIRCLCVEMADHFAPAHEAEYGSQVFWVARRHLNRLRRERGLAGFVLHRTGSRFLDGVSALVEVL